MLKRVIFFCCCLALVTGCAPKKYPHADRGLRPSQRPYTINGHRYEPIQSHEGFVQTGIASWYGHDFHGRPTSNGERYDMYAMTAAHKTLPLGVYVKVRNRDNGREAVVRVNDRGPFVKGRIIDLSYAAARKLGIDISGTGPVRVEALGYREGPGGKRAFKEPATYDSGTYSVQIGSFREYPNAQRLSDNMKNLFGFSEVRVSNVKGKVFYRVYAGRYTSLRRAETAERNFAEHGYPGCFAVALD
jgi:rare lipoprotein A